MGFFGALASIAKPFVKFIPGVGPALDTVMDVAGAGMGAASDAMTADRSNAGNIEMQKLQMGQTQDRNYFNTMMDRDTAQRTNAGDAWKRLQQAAYLKGGGMKSPGLAGPYSRPAPQVSPDAMTMASNPALKEALMSRATYQHDPFGGEMPTRTLDTTGLDKTAKSGFMEKLLGIAGGAATAYGNRNVGTPKK